MAHDERLKEAEDLVKAGSVVKAMQVLYSIHEKAPNSVEVLTRLVALNLHLSLVDGAIVNLHKLIKLEPSKSAYYDQLAKIYSNVGEWQQACETYFGLILHRPKSPEAHFNLAFYLRKAGRFEESVAQYKVALSHGIANPEEVHLNIAVILADDLRRDKEAEAELMTALSINPEYLPALFNLANLFEDRGGLKKAEETLRRVLSIDPENAKALARLARLPGGDDDEGSLLARLESVSKSPEIPLGDKIDCFYSLGQVYDSRGEYEAAFRNYMKGNQLNSREVPPYDKSASESYFDKIIGTVSKEWIERNARLSDESPIFICGMFRSGSTLVEQILASHPKITAGGERDTFVREFSKPKQGFPEVLNQWSKATFHDLGEKYLKQSKLLFPEAQYLTDKRPDNFMYLGAIKALFPKAKIIYTVRNPLDNCLSVYFVRLSQTMNYAVSLESIAHFLDQQAKLLEHWRSIFGDSMQVVDYEALIHNPRNEIQSVLDYLELEWDDNCLKFHELDNSVKTASAWQVRQPMYKSSSGRWRNYENYIGGLINHYQDHAAEKTDE